MSDRLLPPIGVIFRPINDMVGSKAACLLITEPSWMDNGPRWSAHAWMIVPQSGARVWLAAGVTDMRRGMSSLALLVPQSLGRDPHARDLNAFRGKRGDLLKVLWHDGVGMSLYAKRLELGRFINSPEMAYPAR